MIGQHIGQYRVTERLGAGAMGVVYRARDERLGRDVALKLLPVDALGDEAARRRLEHEARTASALNHPHICTIYDVGEAEVTPLHLAAAQGHADVVRLLLAAGADPNIRDSKHDGDAIGWAESGRVPPAPQWRDIVRILKAHAAKT